jgi:hypothetical protein
VLHAPLLLASTGRTPSNAPGIRDDSAADLGAAFTGGIRLAACRDERPRARFHGVGKQTLVAVPGDRNILDEPRED